MGVANMTDDAASAGIDTTGVSRPTPEDVQGWVANGYRYRFVRHMVFTINDPSPVRAHLRAATSGVEGVTQIRDAQRWETKPDSVLSVGFTHTGLAAMGVGATTLRRFPTEFRAGAALRARKIGDIAESAPENWDDAFRVSLGLTYSASSAWKLRGGVAWDQTPVSDEFRTVRIPDNSRIWAAVGATYRFSERARIDFGYAHLFVDDAAILKTEPAAGTVRGSVKGSVDILSAQAVIAF